MDIEWLVEVYGEFESACMRRSSAVGSSVDPMGLHFQGAEGSLFDHPRGCVSLGFRV